MTQQALESTQSHRPIINEIQSLANYRYLIGELILRDIKTRYKRSLLGVAWTMVNPLLTMLVMTIVFSQLFAFSLPRYPVYLLTGVLLWNFFSETTVSAIRNLIWSSALVRRIYIPKSLFAVAAVGTGLVNLLLALVPLGIIILLTGSQLGLPLLFLPVALLLVSAFSLGVGLAVSTQAVFFTDVVDMYQILLLAWMYLTPIFYPPEIIADKFRWIHYVNPMYYILACFRAPLYLNEFPEPRYILGAVVFALVALVVGGVLFARKSDEFAYYL